MTQDEGGATTGETPGVRGAAAEHEHGPDPQRAARGEEDDAKPANGVPVESQISFRSV